MNLRLGGEAAIEDVISRRNGLVSIPVLVNLRLGASADAARSARLLESQFLFW